MIFFGPVAVAGTYYVQALTVNSTIIAAGLSPGLISVAILTVNNLRDIDSDRNSGKKTLAVRFGRGYAIGQYVGVIILAALIPVSLTLLDSSHKYSALATLTLVPGIFLFSRIRKRRGADLNSLLAQTGGLLLIFTVLFCVGWML